MAEAIHKASPGAVLLVVLSALHSVHAISSCINTESRWFPQLGRLHAPVITILSSNWICSVTTASPIKQNTRAWWIDETLSVVGTQYIVNSASFGTRSETWLQRKELWEMQWHRSWEVVKSATRLFDDQADKRCDNYFHSELGEKGFSPELGSTPATSSILEKYLDKYRVFWEVSRWVRRWVRRHFPLVPLLQR